MAGRCHHWAAGGLPADRQKRLEEENAQLVEQNKRLREKVEELEWALHQRMGGLSREGMNIVDLAKADLRRAMERLDEIQAPIPPAPHLPALTPPVQDLDEPISVRHIASGGTYSGPMANGSEPCCKGDVRVGCRPPLSHHSPRSPEAYSRGQDLHSRPSPKRYTYPESNEREEECCLGLISCEPFTE